MIYLLSCSYFGPYSFSHSSLYMLGFMIKGLQETEGHLRGLNVPFHLLMGDPVVNVPAFARQHGARALVTDFSPVRIAKTWFTQVAAVLDGAQPVGARMPFYMVDSHNIVPCWVASDKLEYGARTIRTKIQAKMSEFLTEIPEPGSNPQTGLLESCPLTDWDAALASLQINREVTEVDWLVPGRAGALATLNKFIETGLKDFAESRNDPNRHVCSNLSPYFHFGQISPLRVVLILKQLKRHAGSVDVFVEEAVVRRELADNFVYYNPHYDSIQVCKM